MQFLDEMKPYKRETGSYLFGVRFNEYGVLIGRSVKDPVLFYEHRFENYELEYELKILKLKEALILEEIQRRKDLKRWEKEDLEKISKEWKNRDLNRSSPWEE